MKVTGAMIASLLAGPPCAAIACRAIDNASPEKGVMPLALGGLALGGLGLALFGRGNWRAFGASAGATFGVLGVAIHGFETDGFR